MRLFSLRPNLASLLAALGVAATLLVGSVPTGPRTKSVAFGRGESCNGGYSSVRDPANPLALPNNPGSNPLVGAHFFVDGPRHGSAASTIAQLLGLDPSRFADSVSWASFKASFQHGSLAGRLSGPGRASLRWQVNELVKIADQPEVQRFSAFSEGGGPGAIFGQATKIFCHNLTADPGSIPVVNTYFAHPGIANGCGSRQIIADAMPTFKRRIDEMAAATGNRPVVYLLELDALGSSACIARAGALGAWEDMLRYEVDKISSLPHTVVYIEGGYSDANSVGYTARALNRIGISHIRGFFTNDTHTNWTAHEVAWAEAISRRTHGAHYIVNTAQNGHGPKRNRNRMRFGNEQLCNPPGRGLGPRLTTQTGFPHADAFMWTHVPGNSSGSCHGGTPSGTFWAARAIAEAAHAQAKLGPGYPNNPF